MRATVKVTVEYIESYDTDHYTADFQDFLQQSWLTQLPGCKVTVAPVDPAPSNAQVEAFIRNDNAQRGVY